MSSNLILTPPVTFIIVSLSVLIFAGLLSKLAFKGGKQADDTSKSYACGEDMPTNLIQPDYSAFFPFAFFFTILHVVTLMVTTMPVGNLSTLSIALLYLAGAVIALFILFRREGK